MKLEINNKRKAKYVKIEQHTPKQLIGERRNQKEKLKISL